MKTIKTLVWQVTYGKTMDWMSQKTSLRICFLISVGTPALWDEQPTNRIALEHENAYVRSSTAAALAEAVIDYWPATVSVVLSTLQEFYREKVRAM